MKSRNTYFFRFGLFSARILQTYLHSLMYLFIINFLFVGLSFLVFLFSDFFLLKATDNILNVSNFDCFFDILVNILNYTKLKFNLAHEELEDSVLSEFFGDLRSAVYAETGENFKEVDHEDLFGVDFWWAVRRLFSAQHVV